jgi:hypothetical protein
VEEGAAHSLEQLMCVRGAPTPVYKGGRGEEVGHRRAPSRRSPTWAPSRIHPPFLLSEGERGKEREREKERGAPPLP